MHELGKVIGSMLTEKMSKSEDTNTKADEAKDPSQVRVKSSRQMVMIQLLVEVLRKARNLSSKSKLDENIFNIDDLLVEMAVLKTNEDLYFDTVFEFKVKHFSQKWM